MCRLITLKIKWHLALHLKKVHINSSFHFSFLFPNECEMCMWINMTGVSFNQILNNVYNTGKCIILGFGLSCRKSNPPLPNQNMIKQLFMMNTYCIQGNILPCFIFAPFFPIINWLIIWVVLFNRNTTFQGKFNTGWKSERVWRVLKGWNTMGENNPIYSIQFRSAAQ